MEQRSKEWFKARAGKVTSSKAIDLMAVRGLGKTAENYALQLINDDLVEVQEEGVISADMQHGIDCEPLAVNRYEIETFSEVEEIGFIPFGDNQGSSPDGLVGKDGQIEIKCPKQDKHLRNLLSKECPKEYFDQIQHQMLCSGRKWCDFVSFNPRFKYEHQIKIIRVYPCDKWRDKWEVRLTEFLELKQTFKNQL